MVRNGLRLLFGMLVACGAARAGILTLSLNVRENWAPSRKAILTVSDGSNSLTVDLYRFTYPGELPGLGYCSPRATGCVFTPGGNLTTNPLVLSSSALVLNGVPVVVTNPADYQVTIGMSFTGGTPISLGASLGPWGPQTLSGDLFISVVETATGICVFCGHAPMAVGTASGYGIGFLGYPDYWFTYVASGENVPEPAGWGVTLAGLIVLAGVRVGRGGPCGRGSGGT